MIKNCITLHYRDLEFVEDYIFIYEEYHVEVKGDEGGCYEQKLE